MARPNEPKNYAENSQDVPSGSGSLSGSSASAERRLRLLRSPSDSSSGSEIRPEIRSRHLHPSAEIILNELKNVPVSPDDSASLDPDSSAERDAADAKSRSSSSSSAVLKVLPGNKSASASHSSSGSASLRLVSSRQPSVQQPVPPLDSSGSAASEEPELKSTSSDAKKEVPQPKTVRRRGRRHSSGSRSKDEFSGVINPEPDFSQAIKASGLDGIDSAQLPAAPDAQAQLPEAQHILSLSSDPSLQSGASSQNANSESPAASGQVQAPENKPEEKPARESALSRLKKRVVSLRQKLNEREAVSGVRPALLTLLYIAGILVFILLLCLLFIWPEYLPLLGLNEQLVEMLILADAACMCFEERFQPAHTPEYRAFAAICGCIITAELLTLIYYSFQV